MGILESKMFSLPSIVCLFNYVQLSMTLRGMRAYIYDENKGPPVKYEIWFKATLGLSDLCF